MKKLSFLLAFVLLFSFCLGGCGQPQPNPRLDDLNMLCDTLEKNHYNLYANVSEEEFQAEREKNRQADRKDDRRRILLVGLPPGLVGRGRAHDGGQYRRALYDGFVVEHQKV